MVYLYLTLEVLYTIVYLLHGVMQNMGGLWLVGCHHGNIRSSRISSWCSWRLSQGCPCLCGCYIWEQVEGGRSSCGCMESFVKRLQTGNELCSPLIVCLNVYVQFSVLYVNDCDFRDLVSCSSQKSEERKSKLIIHHKCAAINDDQKYYSQVALTLWVLYMFLALFPICGMSKCMCCHMQASGKYCVYQNIRKL